MMILRSAPASPFGRKVKIAAALLGLDREIKIVLTDTVSAEDPVRRDNPLGKIPTLVLEDGTAVYDSRVIVSYLDMRAGGGIVFPREPMARIHAEIAQATADGLMDAALAIVYEGRWRTEDKHEPVWLAHQQGKIDRVLAVLEAAPPALDRPVGIGAIATACALGYLDLRLAGAWRHEHPRLVAWLDRFAADVPAFAATAMKP